MSASLMCHGCGSPGTAEQFRAHGLFCSKTCEDRHALEADQVENELIEAGFVKHPSVSNLWTKDGVAISQEAAHRGDLEELIRKHKEISSLNRV